MLAVAKEQRHRDRNKHAENIWVIQYFAFSILISISNVLFNNRNILINEQTNIGDKTAIKDTKSI